jgi:hypothetical protein
MIKANSSSQNSNFASDLVAGLVVGVANIPDALASTILAGVNPKNLGLTLAAALTIAQDGLSSAQPWIALVVFVILSSISVAAPVLYYLAAGAATEKTLTSWKAWLTANNATVMIVLFLVLGVKLVGDGLGGLLG